MGESIDRRSVLRRAVCSATAIALGSGLPLASAAAASGTAAEELLTSLARSLFPHPMLPDSTYATVVAAVLRHADEVALVAAAAPYRRAITDPAGRAVAAAVNSFLAAPVGETFRSQVMLGLYDDLQVTRLFGYQGPSLELGGYIDRGFGDLDWLPNPPVMAHG